MFRLTNRFRGTNSSRKPCKIIFVTFRCDFSSRLVVRADRRRPSLPARRTVRRPPTLKTQLGPLSERCSHTAHLDVGHAYDCHCLEIHAIILSTKWWLGVRPRTCVTSDLEVYVVHGLRQTDRQDRQPLRGKWMIGWARTASA